MLLANCLTKVFLQCNRDLIQHEPNFLLVLGNLVKFIQSGILTSFFTIFYLKSRRYRKYYANDIRQFVDDGYIYWYYIHHLLQASRIAEAISVLKDFVWLENCIKSTGPVHVISLFNSVIKEAEITTKVFSHTQVLISSCLIIEDFRAAIFVVEISNFNAYFWLLRQFFTILLK